MSLLGLIILALGGEVNEFELNFDVRAKVVLFPRIPEASFLGKNGLSTADILEISLVINNKLFVTTCPLF